MGKESAFPQKKQDLRHSEDVSSTESSLLNNPKAGLLRCLTPRNDVYPSLFTPNSRRVGKAIAFPQKKKAAFTLAEVLITLGIIGVVAAMTLPTLIAKYQEKAIDTQFKRVYSNIYNAMTMIKAKNGEIPQCYYTQNNSNGGNDRTQVAECVQFYKELSEQLKVLKICEGNAYSKGCIPKYQGVDTIKRYEDTSTINSCGGFSQSNILNRNYAYVFNDGAIMFLYDKLPGWGSVLAVDVNGKKGPNKWGYDVFAFGWKERNHTVFLEVVGCELQEEGGRPSSDILLNAVRK